MFDSVRGPLNQARDEARAYLEDQGHKPRVFTGSNIGAFLTEIPGVLGLVGRSPEILLFAMVQWLVILLAYLAWVQMLHWIPDSIWNAVASADEDTRKGVMTFMNLVLLAWSFFIVCAASYPIGLCNAAMVAVQDLQVASEKPTIAKCLAVADKHLGRIWVFTALDSWITVKAILNRLPRKHYNHTALDELLYYSWKVATMGVVPALVNGRDFLGAGRDSVKLLEAQPGRAIGLRLGYSAVCWVVGITTYVLSLFLVVRDGVHPGQHEFIYNFYLWAAIPIVISAGLIAVVLRPFYLLSVARFYTDMNDVRGEVERDLSATQSAPDLALSWRAIVFMWMLGALVVAVCFGDQLGLTAGIRMLAQRDLANFN